MSPRLLLALLLAAGVAVAAHASWLLRGGTPPDRGPVPPPAPLPAGAPFAYLNNIVLPCGHRCRGMTAGGGGPNIYTCTEGHRYALIGSRYVPDGD